MKEEELTAGRGKAGVLETIQDAPFPLYVNPVWRERFPWLLQGTTGRRSPEDPLDVGDGLFQRLSDFRLFGLNASEDPFLAWRQLREWSAFPLVAHSQQPHGTTILTHRGGGEGLVLGPDADGHLTADSGVLLAITAADCVPVFLVVPHLPAVALLHAGWRGVAQGALALLLDELKDRLGAHPHQVELHLGPAICKECYEVGRDVVEALGESLPPEVTKSKVDLRAILLRQGESLGIPPSSMTVSEHCTRCGPGHFYSHRGGAAERQVGIMGIRWSEVT